MTGNIARAIEGAAIKQVSKKCSAAGGNKYSAKNLGLETTWVGRRSRPRAAGNHEAPFVARRRESNVLSKFYGQATKGMRVDALAHKGDEGRS